MATTKELILKLFGDTSSLDKSLKSTTSKISKLGDNFTRVGQKAALKFTALSGTIFGLTKAFGDIEKGLANVYTLLDDRQLQQFGDTIKTQVTSSVSDLGFAIEDATKAMFDTVSALGAGTKASESFEQAQKLAIGGVAPLSVAVDGLTSIINAYGKETTKAKDVSIAFFTAQKYGKTTVAELAANIGKVAPVAKQAGIGFDVLLAATSQLTLGGLSTEEATTALRQAIAGLIKPSVQAEEVLRRFGVPIGATEVKAVGFTTALRKLAEAAREDQDSLAEMIPNIRALTAISSLGSEELENLDMIIQSISEESLKGASSADVLSKAFRKQQATVSFAMGKMAGSLKIAAATIGEALAPSIIALSNIVSNFSKELKKLSPEQKEFIARALIMTTVGFGLVAIFATLTGSILKTTSVLLNLTKVFKIIIPLIRIATFAINGLLTLNPVALAIIAVLGTLYGAFRTNLLGIRDLANRVINFIVDKFGWLADAIKKTVGFFKSVLNLTEISESVMAVQDQVTASGEEFIQIQTLQMDTLENATQQHTNSLLNIYSDYFNLLAKNQKKSGININKVLVTIQKARMKLLMTASEDELKLREETLSNLEELTKSKNQSLSAIGKAAAMFNIIVATQEGAMKAYAALAGIPIVGPGLGIAAATALIAYGGERLAEVQGASLGFQKGASSIPDDTLGMFNQKEIVIPASFSEGIRTGELALVGDENLTRNGGATYITNEFHFGDVIGTPTDELIEEIENRIFERETLKIGGIQ